MGTLVCGIAAFRLFGKDSPWFWTVALLAALGAGLLLLGNSSIHRVADRLDREASERDDDRRSDPRSER
jgi:hypothetical protein